jgi:predicted RNA-binding Zn-ribbon protein involved in translation (DUF1610 family)
MALFERRHQASTIHSDVEVTAAPGESAAERSPVDLLRRAFATVAEPHELRWRFVIEMALIGVGALTLSILFIWATVTERVGAEAIVVITVVLMLAIFTVSHTMSYHTRILSLQRSARESVAKAKLATEIMMEFLRDFTLKNQETITQLADSQKVRIIEELRQAVGALATSVTDIGVRRELAQIEETIERKIMAIPTGVAFPLPRLEMFDQALRHLDEPARPVKCPHCGGTQARISQIDSREGVRYTCVHCTHEFSLGITVMIEKHS